MRKAPKLLHTLAACGLIGGIVCHMILLYGARQDTAAAYADLRGSIAAIGNALLLPSLGVWRPALRRRPPLESGAPGITSRPGGASGRIPR